MGRTPVTSRDMAAEALNGGVRIPRYDGSNPEEVHYAERKAFARRMHAETYPPQQVTEPAAVSVTITGTTYGTSATINDLRNHENGDI